MSGEYVTYSYIFASFKRIATHNETMNIYNIREWGNIYNRHAMCNILMSFMYYSGSQQNISSALRRNCVADFVLRIKRKS